MYATSAQIVHVRGQAVGKKCANCTLQVLQNLVMYRLTHWYLITGFPPTCQGASSLTTFVWNSTPLRSDSLCSISLVPSPQIPARGRVWWHWNNFLVVQARNFMPILCNQPRAGPTLLCNAMHNQRTVFSLAGAKPPADIARSLLRDQMQGHMKIVELQSDWLSQK